MEKYHDGVLVTGEKTVDFIRKVLLIFGNRNKGKNFGKPLGIQSIRGYVAAIVDLWQVHFTSYLIYSNHRVNSILNKIAGPLQGNINPWTICLINCLENLPILETIK
jgi:hypothetical protein